MTRHWDLEFKHETLTQIREKRREGAGKGERSRVRKDGRKETQRKTGEEKWWGWAAYADLETKPPREQLAALLGASFCFRLLLLLVPDENVWMAFHHILKVEQKCTVLTHHEFYAESQDQGNSWKWWDCSSTGSDREMREERDWLLMWLSKHQKHWLNPRNGFSGCAGQPCLHSGETAETNCV